ncbi:hypothetical protein [Lactiplantibacillus fabifermentans]|uniref:Uncharacterized protein n=2 Tax=Lactiplantibacillus fabifermentans TaxID=483011 RepID=A0A0R2NQV0_9LACO|nr:hypothetical protein [Lactiplantibacillus fabifermentans]ETY73747.1 hypothetical protein LFAB_10835 [Lactiplantibacillus fabifermentans T30PCM01]KRO28055.1 hypothetical protein DY78_GL002688 [Lactiplantibacillus fabifermentans DSM 21115]
MRTADFEHNLLKALDGLTENDIQKIREEVGVDKDYEIDIEGHTHIVNRPKDVAVIDDADKGEIPKYG